MSPAPCITSSGRGNAHQKIFLSKRDFQRYLSYLAHYQQRDRFHVFAYVLMPNHVHLLIETSDVPLSRTMQRLNSRYSLVFNRVHRRGDPTWGQTCDL